jgi:hypothetical protein
MGEFLNKSWSKYEGNLDELSYIKNFNWFKTWFHTIKIELFEFSLTAFLAGVLSFFSFKKISTKLKKDEVIELKSIFKILSLIFLISLSVFIFKLPVIRMSHYLFILIPILFLMKLFSKFLFIPNKLTISLILFLSLTFNGYKNLLRINDGKFKNDLNQIIKPLNPSGQYKKELGDFIYYVGWYGNYPAGNVVLDNSNFAHKKIFIFDIIYNLK